MEAVLDVEGIAYCALDVEGSRMPPTPDLIHKIMMQEGFGIAIPVLQMHLMDQRGSLSKELNLQDGTLITIKIAKRRENVKTYKFRVFDLVHQSNSAGPLLVVTAILDVPKWSAGVFTEAIRGTSAKCIQEIAGRAGLKYVGPDSSPDDSMTWLNVNQTRSSFSEDVAMRGYASNQSCMYRMLTLDGEVRYFDLLAVLQKAPQFSMLQNTESSAAKGEVVVIRETQDGSTSGFATHWMNYGYKQYEHSLNVEGQTVSDALDVPVLGAGLPINKDVKSQVADRGARVTYVGFDTGTEPKPASNLHEHYDLAYYQNLRILGLFSERINVLTDNNTEVTWGVVCEYLHKDQKGQNFEQSIALSGKYLVGGKTIIIKGGHKYSEAFNLLRPNITELGSTLSVGGSNPNEAGGQNATANNGDINIAAEQATPAPTTAITPNTPPGATVPTVTGATAATNTLQALKDLNTVSPIIPTTPTITGISTQQIVAQDSLRQSVSQLSSSSLRDNLVTSGSTTSLDGYKTLKKYSADFIQTMAGGNLDPVSVASQIDRARTDSSYVKNAAMQRVTNYGSDVTGVQLHNIVSVAEGNKYSVNGAVGDVVSGGIWGDSLRQAGITPSSVKVPLPITLEVIDSTAGKLGTNFLHDATGLGLSADNILINPYATATRLQQWASATNPEALLAEQGAQAYISTFGHVSPTDAATSVAAVGGLAAEVVQMYSRNELITDAGITDSQKMQLGREVLFTFGDPSIVPVVDSVQTITNYGQYQDVTTNRSLVTWANYYSMGMNVADAAGNWKFPFNFPGGNIATTGKTNGNPTTLSASATAWNAKT